MHFSLMGKTRLPFIDSDLLYRGALKGRLDCIQIWLSSSLWLSTTEVVRCRNVHLVWKIIEHFMEHCKKYVDRQTCFSEGY